MTDDREGDPERVNPFDLLVRDPTAPFFLKAGADDADLDIRAGDILVVDRGVPALDGRRVAADMEGALKVMRLSRRGGRSWLRSSDGETEISGREHALVWGVVMWTLREG